MERKELIERLRVYGGTSLAPALMEQAADMLEADGKAESQRPRLTDEEIDSVPFNGFTDLRQRFESENECLRAFARAIEKKVRGEA